MKCSRLRKELLLGTVALVAGIGLASAQGLREGGPGGGSERGMSSGSSQMAPESRESAGPKSEGAKSHAARIQNKSESRHEGAAARESSRGEHQLNHGQAQREESTKGSRASKRSTNGQAKSEQRERSTTGQGSTEKNESAKGAMSREEKAKATEGKKEGAASGHRSAQKKNENATTGQAPSTGAAADKNSDKSQSSESTKTKSPQGQSSQTQGSPQQNRATGASTQTQAGTTVRSQAGATVTAQQQTTIQQNVLSARNAPRVDRVNFDIRTDAVVPSHVHFARLSAFPILVDVFPRYRHDSFFVVEDEIVIVEPRHHRIVDVVPVGPRAHYSRASSTSTSVVDLSEPEIREVQHVLIERGLLHGRVTGVWDDRTRVALVAFQRREGFEASGRIDTRTVSALGLSGRINVQGGSASQSSSSTSTTETQGGARQPSAQQRTSGQAPASSRSGVQNAPAQGQSQNQPAKGSTTQQPSSASTRPGQYPSPSATTGQGATSDKRGTEGKPQAQPSGSTALQPSSGATEKKSEPR